MRKRETHDLRGWMDKGKKETSPDAWSTVHTLPFEQQRTQIMLLDSLMEHVNNRLTELMMIVTHYGAALFAIRSRYMNHDGKVHGLQNLLAKKEPLYRKHESTPTTAMRDKLRAHMIRANAASERGMEFIDDPGIKRFPIMLQAIGTSTTLVPSVPRSLKNWMQYVLDQTLGARGEPYSSSFDHRWLLMKNLQAVVTIVHASLEAAFCAYASDISGTEMGRLELTDIARDAVAGPFLKAAEKTPSHEMRKFYTEVATQRAKAAKWIAMIDVLRNDPVFLERTEIVSEPLLLEKGP